MNTCGTCKYFGKLIEVSLDVYPEEGDDIENTRYHQCDLLRHLNKSALRSPITDSAGVIDGSGYRATFCVSEEFGCNQWKTRG